MPIAPKNYDEWLALSEDDKRAIHLTVWDDYARDGIAFAYMAASRLALSCNRKVLNIEIGTYHGGEYLLHMTVSATDYRDCPPMLSDEFEGFRVVWMPARDFEPLEATGATLEGSWVSEDSYYEFDFVRNNSGLVVTGQIGGTDTNFHIQHPNLNGPWVIFSAYDPHRRATTNHALRLVAPDIAECDLTTTQKFLRKNQ
ncbi:MAG: hypothetical protein V4689_19395 [Verrucomicrobiota bacterium]